MKNCLQNFSPGWQTDSFSRQAAEFLSVCFVSHERILLLFFSPPGNTPANFNDADMGFFFVSVVDTKEKILFEFFLFSYCFLSSVYYATYGSHIKIFLNISISQVMISIYKTVG